MDLKGVLAVTLLIFYILPQVTFTESLECNGKCKCYNTEIGVYSINEDLEEMIFDFNQINSVRMHKIGRSFPNMKKLSVLYNRIQKVKKGDLLFVNNLQSLDLGNNQISEIDDGSFFSQENLEKLLLDGNQLTSIKSMTFL